LVRTFDLVYASVGVLCWIPSFAEWARAASRCLSLGGRLYLRDGHPITDTFDCHRDDGQVVCVGDYFAEGVSFREDRFRSLA
jgi:Rad3-related DNA helicase